MSVKYGDRVVCINQGGHGECVKGTIIDTWQFANKGITDYLVQLDSGSYVNIKPHYSNWFKLDDRILWFENNRLRLEDLTLVCNKLPVPIMSFNSSQLNIPECVELSFFPFLHLRPHLLLANYK